MSANPHETVVAPVTTPAAGSTPAQGLTWEASFVGQKWKTPEEANKGVPELINYASRTKEEAAKLADEVTRLRGALAAYTGGGERPDPAANLSARQKLANELAVEPGLLEQALGETIQQLFMPAVQTMEANSAYLAQPENAGAEERLAKARQYVLNDPTLKADFLKMETASPLRALEWMDMKYQIHEATTRTAAPASEPASNVPAGAIPSSLSTGVRTPAGADAATKEKETLEYFNQTGDRAPYRATVLGQTSGKQIFLKQLEAQLGMG